MRINAIDSVRSFGVQTHKNGSVSNVLNYPLRNLPQIKKLSFMASPLLLKYTNYFHGFCLLTQTNTLNKNAAKYDSALDFINNIAFEKMNKRPDITPLDKEHPVIWSVTSEFAPIKEGGLGSVPPEIRNNAQKLGVSIPTFVPMYLNEGNSTFLEEDGRYTYTRGKNRFSLEKVATFKMDTYRDGKIETIPVEIFLSEDKDDEERTRQLILVKADKYFDGSIYEASAKTEEPEKFAVFSKAVYEFAKLKMEGPKALKDVNIISSDALNRINAPDGMMLNDWQASPIAALMRYKAPMENAFNQLSDSTAERLKNMTIATIGHNCMYQGSTSANNTPEQKREASNNILNTLFDKYTNDIVINAKTRASEVDPSDKALSNLDNSLIINYQNPQDSSVNFLNMGVVLSDFFLPVSQNYAQELISPERNDLSGSVQWALTRKFQSGRMKGIINGNDYKNLNIEAKLTQIKKTTGIDFASYNQQSQKDDVISARLENKYRLYNEYMRPATNSTEVDSQQLLKVKAMTSNIEFYEGVNGANLPVIDKQTFNKTPVLSVMGRLVSQKGIDVAVEAIGMLYKNWEEEFPGYEKPIIYFAGMDNEGGVQRKKIEELKDSILSKEDSSRVVFAHGFVPINAIMAGSDFFLMPSKFEPCGLTQGEAMAVATPVIASAVGGIVDTVNRNGKQTGVLTNPDKKLDAEEFYNALVEGLNIYFNYPDEYQDMVMDSLSEDFSWIQKGKQGPVYDYLELYGINRENLADVD